jgi:hypothetical protein
MWKWGETDSLGIVASVGILYQPHIRQRPDWDFQNKKAAVQLTEIFDGTYMGVMCIDQLIQVVACIQLTGTGSWRDLSGSILMPCSKPEGS